MTRVVVDASVLAKLFSPSGERHADRAVTLLEQWEGGRVTFVAPELLPLELLNVAARKWRLAEPSLTQLAHAIDELAIEVRPVDLSGVVRWSSRGLSAYDAVYVAVAESERLPLITDDDRIVSIAPDHAVALGEYPGA